jgi:glycerol 2-dehydrogenase (NADP+)
VNEDRVQANFQLDGWELSTEEMNQINNLKSRFKVCDDKWLPVQVFFNDDE